MDRSWSRIEEIDHTGLQRILRSDDHQSFVLNQLLENLRAMAQVIDGCPNVRANSLIDERLRIVSQLRSQQALHGGTHPVHDRMKIRRLRRRGFAQLLERGKDGSALRVPEHHDEARAVTRRREFNAANLRGSDDVAGDTNHEEITESLIEDYFRRYPGVRTAEYYGERILRGRQLGAPVVGEWGGATDAGC